MTDRSRVRWIRAAWDQVIIAIAPVLVWQFLKDKGDSTITVSRQWVHRSCRD